MGTGMGHDRESVMTLALTGAKFRKNAAALIGRPFDTRPRGWTHCWKAKRCFGTRHQVSEDG